MLAVYTVAVGEVVLAGRFIHIYKLYEFINRKSSLYCKRRSFLFQLASQKECPRFTWKSSTSQLMISR